MLNFTVKSSSKPEITKIEIEDWTDENNSITIFTYGQGNYEYSINGVDYQDSNIFRNLESGQYQIYLKDKNGCGIATANVFILNYPKFFTPNGDGYNEYWNIKFSILEPKLKVYIYDKYGKFIFQFNSKSNGWDGNYNGLPLPATDYWFEVHRENGKIHKGHFSLKR
jgi:gliding motility-associated-like protein